MIVRIEDHVQQALDRLIEQYKEKENLASLVTAFTEQVQILEDDSYEFKDRLNVNAISGKLLDKFGVIVLQKRFGLEDPLYRLILLAKIGINISNGEPERVISTFKIITQADFVHYMNHSYGEISLATDGSFDEEFTNFVFDAMEKTLASGVRIAEFVFHEDSGIFGFTGPTGGQVIEGFGTVADLSLGGTFAWLRRFTPTFAFEGEDSSTSGFGSLEDPIVGGGFASL